MYKFFKGQFYPYSIQQDYIKAGSWPEGGVDVSEDTFVSFMNPSIGKKIGTATDGSPCWVDDEIDYGYPSMAAIQRDLLMSSASTAIQPLQDAVDLDEATDDETALLKKWKQYRVALNRLDLSTAPDITWPLLPTDEIGS